MYGLSDVLILEFEALSMINNVWQVQQIMEFTKNIDLILNYVNLNEKQRRFS